MSTTFSLTLTRILEVLLLKQKPTSHLQIMCKYKGYKFQVSGGSINQPANFFSILESCDGNKFWTIEAGSL